MTRMETRHPIDAYLRSSPWIDFDHPLVKEKANSFRTDGEAPSEMIRRIFEFVRDEVSHSADIQSRRVTRKASEVLHHREGICYAKSHLLAALLRGVGIPSGISYQRLVHGDTPETGYDIHALNTVYLSTLDRWIRLDARGNKPGVDARFSIDEERLAFPIRPEFDEIDYPENFPEPHPLVIAVLERNMDCRQMYDRDLPYRL